MAEPLFFDFYPKDFAGDALVEAMTTTEVGAYILLLCKAWQGKPPASLPNDDTVLARYARLDSVAWADAKDSVLAAFTLGTDSRWHQKRLRKTYDDTVKAIEAKSKKASDAAKIRWEKERAADAASNADAMREHCSSNAIISDTVSGSENSNSSPKEGGSGGLNFDDTAEGMVTRWKHYYTGAANSQADEKTIVGTFRELLRQGVSPAAICAEIERKDRRKTEPVWEFEKRLLPKKGNNGQPSKRFTG